LASGFIQNDQHNVCIEMIMTRGVNRYEGPANTF
jgi:hypothetical protein